MESANRWENQDVALHIVKTEPEDVVSIEYGEPNVNDQSGLYNYGNDDAACFGGNVHEEFQFKQEGIDTGEDMEYTMESHPDEHFYSNDGHEGIPPDMDHLGTWHYQNNEGNQMMDPEALEQPGTSDMSVFAEKREEQLYPCRYCDYVGNHPRLLSSHMNNRHTKSVIYQCPHCSYSSTISRSTKDHVETKHQNEDDKPIEIKRKCEFCDYSASNATVLKNHMNKHTGAKQHKCSFCNFNTLWEGYLKMHIRRKHSDQAPDLGSSPKEYPCQYCDYKALTPSSLKLHTNKHTREQEHQCPYCPYKTVWTTYIKSHINNKHLKPEKSPSSKEFACSFCDYKAKNSTLLKQHVNKHTRETVHQCPHCPFTTLWMTYMKLHIKRKHTVKIEGEVPEKREFQCQYCSYKAISSSHLKIHENKHTKAVEYKCEQCSFKTTWYGYLKLHTKRKHSENDEKPNLTVKTTFPCKFCSYKAINLSTLKVHQNKHTREILYNCPHCEFKTTWRAYLKMHIEKHNVENFKSRKQRYNGIKSFPCQYCDYKATQLGSLKLHVNSKHTRKVLHKCPKCDYQCAVYGNLKMHIKRKHSLKPEADGKYHCQECEFVSESSNDFKLHLNEKHDIKIEVHEINSEDDKIYSCQHCSYTTLYPQVMKKHVNKHTRQNVIKCPHCPYTTVWNHYMKVHIRRHSEPKTGRKRFTKPNTDQNRLFPCQFCDHRSLSFSSLRDHINSVHTREILHKCPYCEHKCTLKGNLRGHIRRKHPNEFIENEKKYSCDKCDFQTSIMRNMKIHRKKEHNIEEADFRTENGEFQCQYCEYKARSYYSLKIHTNKHTKENSYHCPLCEFVTRWPNYLSKHIKQHSLNKRKVTCLYCDYKGCSTFRLRKHIESLHKVDQHYPCPKAKCDFKTIHYPSLRMHLKGSIHADTRRRPYVSGSRNFSYKYEPNEGRYFACDYCEYASKTQGNLDLHIKNKHEKKVILKCTLCSYRTPSKNYLNRHFKVKHQVKKEEQADEEMDCMNTLDFVSVKYEEPENAENETIPLNNEDLEQTDEDDELLSNLRVKQLLKKGIVAQNSHGSTTVDDDAMEQSGRLRRRKTSVPCYIEDSSSDELSEVKESEIEAEKNQEDFHVENEIINEDLELFTPVVKVEVNMNVSDSITEEDNLNTTANDIGSGYELPNQIEPFVAPTSQSDVGNDTEQLNIKKTDNMDVSLPSREFDNRIELPSDAGANIQSINQLETPLNNVIKQENDASKVIPKRRVRIKYTTRRERGPFNKRLKLQENTNEFQTVASTNLLNLKENSARQAEPLQAMSVTEGMRQSSHSFENNINSGDSDKSSQLQVVTNGDISLLNDVKVKEFGIVFTSVDYTNKTTEDKDINYPERNNSLTEYRNDPTKLMFHQVPDNTSSSLEDFSNEIRQNNIPLVCIPIKKEMEESELDGHGSLYK